MSENFKVGDRIRITEATGWMTVGNTYEIIGVDADDSLRPVKVLDNDGAIYWPYRTKFELVVEEPAPAPSEPLKVVQSGFSVTSGWQRFTLDAISEDSLAYSGDNDTEISVSEAAPLHALLGAFLASKAS